MTATDGHIRISAAGPLTTVQDFGRLHLRRLGIPSAGTLCPDWLQLGNALLGNPADAAALEFRLMGPSFTVEVDDMQAVVAGPAELRIDGADGARRIKPWTVVKLSRGDDVTVGSVSRGTVALLCVSGGVATPPVLGSRATYSRAGLGGLQGRSLQIGDLVPIGSAIPKDTLSLPDVDDPTDQPIRVILGPQADHFSNEQIGIFLSESFFVTTNVDRMGMRLEGPKLKHRTAALSEIVSDGIVPGAVQVPGTGNPIVLLADGQTVGGYPKIATVISADLPRLGRLAPGTLVSFSAVTVREAEDALERHQTWLRTMIASAGSAIEIGDVDLRLLYETNLVSGAVNGTEETE